MHPQAPVACARPRRIAATAGSSAGGMDCIKRMGGRHISMSLRGSGSTDKHRNPRSGLGERSADRPKEPTEPTQRSAQGDDIRGRATPAVRRSAHEHCEDADLARRLRVPWAPGRGRILTGESPGRVRDLIMDCPIRGHSGFERAFLWSIVEQPHGRCDGCART